jgi:hypothetical protein
MTTGEKEAMCEVDDGRSTFLGKLEDLWRLGDDYCVFDRLDRVLHALTGDEGYLEDNDRDEESEGEEDEDDSEALQRCKEWFNSRGALER